MHKSETDINNDKSRTWHENPYFIGLNSEART